MNAPAAAGLLGLAASVACLASGASWIRPWFYLPAWWSLLALVAGLNRAAGADVPRGRAWLRMALLSVPFWLAYEVLNLRLGDWEYHGLPASRPLRWAGYALAFATVLPAVVEVSAFVRARWPAGAAGTRRPGLLGEEARAAALAAGLLCLALPLAWPRLFFPLVWAPAFLLLEHGVAAARPRASWLAALSEGGSRPFAALLAGGLVCGLLWESLNFWAGAKWRYAVPWPAGPRLFEMPLLGYLGFPPFALGCSSAFEAHEAWWEDAPPGVRLAWAVLLALLSLLAFSAVDAGTVRSLG